MKKSVLLIVLAILCASLLVSCGCKHEQWNAANCETAKTCAECGETEGEPHGHKWADANCTTPKTCSACQKTEGSPLGHAWVDAGCETPKTCQSCGLTEGEPLGHTWQDATTEAPKTCSGCNLTEGERIITDSRFTTAACEPLFGQWALSVPLDGEMMGLEDFNSTIDISIHLEFTNDGKITMTFKVDDPEAFNAAIKQYTMDMIYQQYADSGMSKEEADAEILDSTGMTMEEYVDAAFSTINLAELFDVYNIKGNYYVNGDQLYIGTNWNEEMQPSVFRFQGDKLSIPELTTELGLVDNAFSRVADDAA